MVPVVCITNNKKKKDRKLPIQSSFYYDPDLNYVLILTDPDPNIIEQTPLFVPVCNYFERNRYNLILKHAERNTNKLNTGTGTFINFSLGLTFFFH